MGFLVGVLALTVVGALACALPGVFVVLRRNAMLVDAISHAVLPGIVVGYAVTHRLDSPLLTLGAAVTGLLVVLGSEYLTRTGLITGDAPQGLVFPALFSLGVIGISTQFSRIHLDVHAVLVGDLNLAAFAPLVVGDLSLGPRYLWIMAAVLVINIAFLALCWRPLVVSTFDSSFAATLGLRVGLFNTAFMFCVSVTVTAAFHAAGAILVIAWVVVPGAIAQLLCRRLPALVAVACGSAVVLSLAGFWLAYVLDAATSAGMAVTYGVTFLAVFAVVRRRRRRAGTPHTESGRVPQGFLKSGVGWRPLSRGKV
ncbi:MAG: metal ABC transporter permease [Propionibacteriaceae bacterium]